MNKTWNIVSPLNIARSHPAVSEYNGKIYAIGGGGPDFQSLNSIEIYDTIKDKWSFGREMPTVRSGCMAVTLNNKIYVIGGGYKQPDGEFRFLKKVEIYDPEMDTWETGSDMLMPHDYPGCAVLNNHIYILGGHHPDATKGGPRTDPGFTFCERLNPKEDKWAEITPLPTPRFALTGGILNGKILAMGGVAFTPNGFNNFDLIEIYDTDKKVWYNDNNFLLPWPAAAHATIISNEELYIFGGYSGNSITNRSAVYSNETNRWTELQPMKKAGAAIGIARIENKIYLAGGWAEDGRTPVNDVSIFS